MTELDALLILNALPGIANKRVLALIQYFGSGRKVLQQNIAEFVATRKSRALVEKFDYETFLHKEHKLIAKEQVEVLTYFDPLYPLALREIPDPPVLLYIKGRLPSLERAIAMVGSRRASLYGIENARRFAFALAEKGSPILSGFARGIDTAAHQGALDAKGSTVAVLGSGIRHIYPAENHRLIERITERGALISEFPMTMEPFPFNFPRRNRIVSGLSQGLVVVEAALKSGALITADFALEQGRDVYCIPGPVQSPASAGVHHLIQQGAKLVTCAEDILEDLTMPHDVPLENAALMPCDPEMDLTEEEQAVFNRLSHKPQHLDELGDNAGMVLLKLELKQLVKELPGKFYIRSSAGAIKSAPFNRTSNPELRTY